MLIFHLHLDKVHQLLVHLQPHLNRLQEHLQPHLSQLNQLQGLEESVTHNLNTLQCNQRDHITVRSYCSDRESTITMYEQLKH